jgi:hypothetical protein
MNEERKREREERRKERYKAGGWREWLFLAGTLALFALMVGVLFSDSRRVAIQETYALPWPLLVSFSGFAEGTATETSAVLKIVEQEFARLGTPSPGLLRESDFQAAAERVFAERGLPLRYPKVRFLPQKDS